MIEADILEFCGLLFAAYASGLCAGYLMLFWKRLTEQL